MSDIFFDMDDLKDLSKRIPPQFHKTEFTFRFEGHVWDAHLDHHTETVVGLRSDFDTARTEPRIVAFTYEGFAGRRCVPLTPVPGPLPEGVAAGDVLARVGTSGAPMMAECRGALPNGRVLWVGVGPSETRVFPDLTKSHMWTKVEGFTEDGPWTLFDHVAVLGTPIQARVLAVDGDYLTVQAPLFRPVRLHREAVGRLGRLGHTPEGVVFQYPVSVVDPEVSAGLDIVGGDDDWSLIVEDESGRFLRLPGVDRLQDPGWVLS